MRARAIGNHTRVSKNAAACKQYRATSCEVEQQEAPLINIRENTARADRQFVGKNELLFTEDGM